MLHVRYVSFENVLLEEDPHRRTIYIDSSYFDSPDEPITTVALPYMIYLCHIRKVTTGMFSPLHLGVGSRNKPLNSAADFVWNSCLGDGGDFMGVCLGDGHPTGYKATAVDAAKALVRGYYATDFAFLGGSLLDPTGNYMNLNLLAELTKNNPNYVPKISEQTEGYQLFNFIGYDAKLLQRRKKVVTVNDLKKELRDRRAEARKSRSR